MKNRYYDPEEFKTATACINTNPEEAERRFTEYLKKYPYDRSAIAYHAHVLIVLNRLDEAEIKLDRLEHLIATSRDNNEKLKKSRKLFIKTKVSLLCYQRKFEELYVFWNSNFHEIKALTTNGEFDISPAYFWCLVNLGKVDTSNRNGDKTSKSGGNTYEYRQMIEYSYEDFLAHVKKHTDSTMGNPRVFRADFPFAQVIEEVKKKIPKEAGLNSNFTITKYVFRYPECGIVKESNDKNSPPTEKKSDYFMVVVLHDTTNILTMYPAANNLCEYQPNVIDLSYLLSDVPVIGPTIPREMKPTGKKGTSN